MWFWWTFFENISKIFSCPFPVYSGFSFYIWTPEISLWIIKIPALGYSFDGFGCLYGAYTSGLAYMSNLHNDFFTSYSWSLARSVENRVDSTKKDLARQSFVYFIFLLEFIFIFSFVNKIVN
jgi:heme O synthase-like polyprenyltransferase